MADFEPDAAISRAIELVLAGELPDAQRQLDAVLDRDGQHAEALHLSGLIRMKSGDLPGAIALLCRAVATGRALAAHWANLGEMLRMAGDLPGAEAACRKSAELDPNHAPAHNNLGCVLDAQGRLEEAKACFQRTIALDPDHQQAHLNLANVLRRLGRSEDALAPAQRAVALGPTIANAHRILARALHDLDRTPEAVAVLRHACHALPNEAVLHGELAQRLLDIGDHEAAAEAYQRAAALTPDYFAVHHDLATCLLRHGRVEEALDEYRIALRLAPDNPHCNSSYLVAMLCSANFGRQDIDAACRHWGRRLMQGVPPPAPHANDRDPDRPLRVGYVSCDFRDHPVGRHFALVIANHDRSQYHATCYYNDSRQDAATQHIRSYAARWRTITSLSDGELAQRVRADGIDILVDLALHTFHNRLGAFALKPAPVQITHMGYPGTTGLPAIDGRISDRWLDPPGEEPQSVEHVLRLPHSFWCWGPPENGPPLRPRPSDAGGPVTFGCFCHSGKHTPQTMDLWARVLAAVPEARMLILVHNADVSNRYLLDGLTGRGVARGRIVLLSRLPLAEYLDAYNGMDICLDTFPYTGHTTTCDALWMGVPVVSLVGPTQAGRGSSSILNTLGLPELLAASAEQYVATAARLARDHDARRSLCDSLRGRMAASPLMDAAGYTRDLESIYRRIWRQWCQTKGHP